jgi:hypothetical protein
MIQRVGFIKTPRDALSVTKSCSENKIGTPLAAIKIAPGEK